MMGQVWPRGPIRFAARNVHTGRWIATEVGIASTRLGRAVGLLGRAGLGRGEGLWIVPSHGVHTCGMRFPIDVVALDANGVVVDIATDLGPWCIRLPRRDVVGILEVAAGAAQASGTLVGHQVAFEVRRSCCDARDSGPADESAAPAARARREAAERERVGVGPHAH